MVIRIRHLIVVLLLFNCVLCYSQQDKLYTQYLNSPSVINPAYAGSRGGVQILGAARTQWVGVEGSPKSSVISVNGPIKTYKMGLGFSLENDNIGVENITDLSVDFSYRISLSSSLFLNLGLKLDLEYYKADIRGSRFVNKNDPLLQESINTLIEPNYGIGVYLYSSKYFVGLSIPRLMNNNVYKGTNEFKKDYLHNYLFAGYVFSLSPILKFKPSFFSSFSNTKLYSSDFTAMFIYVDKLWMGVSYRRDDSYAAIVQYNVTNKFKIGYSYDVTTGEFSKNSNGSHEICLSYDISLKGVRIKSPRYF